MLRCPDQSSVHPLLLLPPGKRPHGAGPGVGGSQNPRDGVAAAGEGAGQARWLLAVGGGALHRVAPLVPETLKASRHGSRIPQERFREGDGLPRGTQLVSEELASPQLA